MTLEEIRKLVRDGKFFSVRFIKRSDGSERLMNCRVRPPVQGGPGMSYEPSQHDLLVVWDLHKRGYRMIPVDAIVELRAHGQRIV